MRINVNIRPSGGYVFRETDGSMHRAGNWAAVIQRVREYREREGRSVETLAEEVMTQACERYPSLCRPEAHNIPAEGVAPVRPPIMVSMNEPSLKARILMWLSQLFGNQVRNEPLAYVSAEEAAARESICAVCPKNEIFMGSGCASCKTSLRDYRNGIIPGRAQYNRLNGCAILGVDLVTAVHLDEVRVNNPTLPENCWRRQAI